MTSVLLADQIFIIGKDRSDLQIFTLKINQIVEIFTHAVASHNFRWVKIKLFNLALQGLPRKSCLETKAALRYRSTTILKLWYMMAM